MNKTLQDEINELTTMFDSIDPDERKRIPKPRFYGSMDPRNRVKARVRKDRKKRRRN